MKERDYEQFPGVISKKTDVVVTNIASTSNEEYVIRLDKFSINISLE